MTELDDLVREASRTINLTYEQRIRVCLQPKPRWLPMFAYGYLLRRLIVVEMTAGTFKAS